MTSSTFFFFFNDTATTEIYTLSLHDALPISPLGLDLREGCSGNVPRLLSCHVLPPLDRGRSEEHTSELQSQSNLVCRLLLEKKKAGYAPPARGLPAPRARQAIRQYGHRHTDH